MEYARPALLDAAGRHFRELRLIIAHCGLPWVDEALFMLTKHPNFFAELSYYIATVTLEELFRFLVHAQQSFVPLEKLFFGDRLPAADQPRTSDAFDRSVRYEIAFWQMAYTRGASDRA